MEDYNDGVETNTRSETFDKFYEFHGLECNVKGKNASITCPNCGEERPDKCNIDIHTGKYNCLICGTSKDEGFHGNAVSFLRWLHKRGMETTSEDSYEQLRQDRKLLYTDTLKAWGVCKSPITGIWVIPGYNAKGNLVQLYKYQKTGQKTLKNGTIKPTWACICKGYLDTGGAHAMFGANLVDSTKSRIYVCEGLWDGCTTYETAKHLRISAEGKYEVTTGDDNFLKSASIMAAPACGVFFQSWSPLFGKHEVYLGYDSDPPEIKKVNGKEIQKGLGGYRGMKKVTEILSNSEEPPTKIYYLKWGQAGYAKEFIDPYDMRDHITSKGDSLHNRVKKLGELLDRFTLTPQEWAGKKTTATCPAPTPAPKVEAEPDMSLTIKECTSWEQLVGACKAAMDFDEGLDRALSAMLAAAIGPAMPGKSPAWLKIIGPPSSGKTTLAEALAANLVRVESQSRITGLHSGYNAGGGENCSLINDLHDRTLIIKDADSLVKEPNFPTTMAEFRDAFDGNTSTHYKNKQGQKIPRINFAVIMCGTNDLANMDNTELGARFLDCYAAEGIPLDKELSIGERCCWGALKGMVAPKSEHAGPVDTVEKVEMKRLCGGYLEYLYTNAVELTTKVVDSATTEIVRKCNLCGALVSYLRARPSLSNNEKTDKERCYRLGEQLTRLAATMAVVLGKGTIDNEVLRRIVRIAFDTSKGTPLDIVKIIYERGIYGSGIKFIRDRTNNAQADDMKMLRFMRKINIVSATDAESILNEYTRKALFDDTIKINAERLDKGVIYTLTPEFKGLYEQMLALQKETGAL